MACGRAARIEVTFHVYVTDSYWDARSGSILRDWALLYMMEPDIANLLFPRTVQGRGLGLFRKGNIYLLLSEFIQHLIVVFPDVDGWDDEVRHNNGCCQSNSEECLRNKFHLRDSEKTGLRKGRKMRRVGPKFGFF